ncbi:MAG TPA: hypothetical protein VE978_16795 [Chitinophagales bacterium]|nr:hypothetical protein [Chitinophagales bacterium]
MKTVSLIITDVGSGDCSNVSITCYSEPLPTELGAPAPVVLPDPGCRTCKCGS